MRSRRRRAAALAVWCCALATSLAACGGDDADTPVVEVFGNIVGEPGRELAKVLHDASAGSGVEIRYVGVTSFNQQLEDRLERGERPGIALIPQPGRLANLHARGLLAPLDDSLVAELEDRIPSQLLDMVTLEGRPVAVPLTIDVKGLVWYRPSVFAEQGLEVPATLDEFETMLEAERTNGDGVAATCADLEAGASTGWVGTDWVESLVLRRLGPERYDEWVAGTLRFDSEEIRAVFDEMDSLLRAPGAVAGGAASVSVPWQAAAAQLLADPPACLTVHQGDFLRREFPGGTSVGPDGTVDFFPMPSIDGGAAPMLVGGLLATPLTDDPGVAAAMEVLAGGRMATGLVRTGEYLSPSSTVDWNSVADPVARRLVDLVTAAPVVRFDGSDMMPTSIGTGTFWSGMTAFFAGEAVPAVLAEIESGRPAEPAVT